LGSGDIELQHLLGKGWLIRDIPFPVNALQFLEGLGVLSIGHSNSTTCPFLCLEILAAFTNRGIFFVHHGF